MGFHWLSRKCPGLFQAKRNLTRLKGDVSAVRLLNNLGWFLSRIPVGKIDSEEQTVTLLVIMLSQRTKLFRIRNTWTQYKGQNYNLKGTQKGGSPRAKREMNISLRFLGSKPQNPLRAKTERGVKKKDKKCMILP